MNMLSLTVPATALAAGDMPFADRAAYAGQLTLIGMATIFAVLALLWGAISLMRWFLQRREERKAQRPPRDARPAKMNVTSDSKPMAADGDDAALVAAITAALAVAAPATVPVTASRDDGAVLSAITAAIAVVWESEHPGTGFRVVSYRHIEKRSAWNIK